jgi:4-diphosphocytidyl-2C-methyl-D-erythritol kinase
VGGGGENELERAAGHVEPRLARLAAALRERDRGWLMTGSGSAFFCHTRTREAADRVLTAIADLELPWTAVTRPAGPWAGPAQV